jgi:hypothetical protein
MVLNCSVDLISGGNEKNDFEAEFVSSSGPHDMKNQAESGTKCLSRAPAPQSLSNQQVGPRPVSSSGPHDRK